jgi:hypothetical protein
MFNLYGLQSQLTKVYKKWGTQKSLIKRLNALLKTNFRIKTLQIGKVRQFFEKGQKTDFLRKRKNSISQD